MNYIKRSLVFCLSFEKYDGTLSVNDPEGVCRGTYLRLHLNFWTKSFTKIWRLDSGEREECLF